MSINLKTATSSDLQQVSTEEQRDTALWTNSLIDIARKQGRNRQPSRLFPSLTLTSTDEDMEYAVMMAIKAAQADSPQLDATDKEVQAAVEVIYMLMARAYMEELQKQPTEQECMNHDKD